MPDYPILSTNSELTSYAGNLTRIQLVDNRVYELETSTSTPDGVLVVAASTTSTKWKLSNKTLDARWFGAKGNGTDDDTNALYLWLNAGVNNNRSLYLPSGTYRTQQTLSCDISGGKNLWIETDGPASTVLYYDYKSPYTPALRIQGDTNLTPKKISGIHFKGKDNTSDIIGVIIENTTAITLLDCRFSYSLVGVRFFNNGDDKYTEQNVVERSEFVKNCKFGIQYTKTDKAAASFRGNGLLNCTANIANGNSFILIDQGCQPYFAPLTVTCWTDSESDNSCSIIDNQSNTEPDFYGTLSVEPFGGPNTSSLYKVAISKNKLVHFSGEILTHNQAVSTGNLKLWSRLQRNALGGISGNLQAVRASTVATGGSNGSPITTVFYPAFVVVRAYRPGYEYKTLYCVNNAGDGQTPGVCKPILELRTFNTVFPSDPGFSLAMDATATLIISSSNFTAANNVTVEVCVTQLGDVSSGIPLTP